MINAHRSWIRVYIIGKSMKWIPIFVLVLMNCSSGILSNDNFVIHEYDIIGADNIKSAIISFLTKLIRWLRHLFFIRILLVRSILVCYVSKKAKDICMIYVLTQ